MLGDQHFAYGLRIVQHEQPHWPEPQMRHVAVLACDPGQTPRWILAHGSHLAQRNRALGFQGWAHAIHPSFCNFKISKPPAQHGATLITLPCHWRILAHTCFTDIYRTLGAQLSCCRNRGSTTTCPQTWPDRT